MIIETCDVTSYSDCLKCQEYILTYRSANSKMFKYDIVVCRKKKINLDLIEKQKKDNKS